MSENEKKEILDAHKLSVEELESVSGGVVIDWPATCSSTVKSGETCWFNDACYATIMKYHRNRDWYGCSSTVADTSMCWSSDFCNLDEIRYATCSNDFWAATPSGNPDVCAVNG